MTERLNVRRMQVPEKAEESDLSFDLKRDIPSDFWRAEMAAFNQDRANHHWPNIAYHLSSAQIMGHPLDVELSAEEKAGMLAYVEERIGREDIGWIGDVEMAAHMAIIGLRPQLSAEALQIFAKKRLEYLQKDKPSSFLDLCACLKILYPESSPPTDLEWSSIEIGLQHQARTSPAWNFAQGAGNAKILDLKRAPPINATAWSSMRAELKERLSSDSLELGRSLSVMRLATDMAILAAENIVVSRKGVEVVQPKAARYKDSTPVQPEALEI